MKEQPLKIKVCGITEKSDIKELIAMPIDYLGFIFYDKSPRYVSKSFYKQIATLPESIKKTGVFVNETIENILQIVALCKLDYVQLHGNESPDYCRTLRNLSNIGIIKTFSVDEFIDPDMMSEYLNICDYFLFDTKCNEYGGSGKKYNWQLLNTYTHSVPFFLSGGISPDDSSEILSLNHPMLHAIDINSLFEITPGYKDLTLITPFIHQIKHHNESNQ